MRLALLAAVAGAIAMPAAAAPPSGDRALHERLIVLDTHFDTPALFGVEGWSVTDRHDHSHDGSQVDYPRMVEGGVDGGVFTVFTAQGPRTEAGHAGARDFALQRIGEIREMAARNSARFEIVTTSEAARALANGPRRFVFISLENSYPLGRDLSLMATFHRLGARMMSPVHTSNNDLSDSATAAPEHGGLSPLGRQWVVEANRLGVLIDASHASDAATEQMIELSRTPIILSHTGARAVFDHPRNIGDDLMRKLAAKGGVIQLNAFSNYMVAVPASPERAAALGALSRKYAGQRNTAAVLAARTAEARAIHARYPLPRATFDDFMKHLLHAISIVGVDHVGISGDFDGGGGVAGFDDVTDFPKVTTALRAAGLSEADIAKVWGGNALRLFDRAQAVDAR